MNSFSGHPCVFFDRDGVANLPPSDEQRYVLRAEDFHLMPGFVETLRVVLAKGYRAVIITNQSGISRGRMTHADLERIHQKLLDHLKAEGLDLHDIFVCDSADDAHPNRKPNPGMILEAAQKHHLDLARSWMVGDQEKDVEAGRRAGVGKTAKIRANPGNTRADLHLPGMLDLARWFEEHLPPAS